MISAISFVLDGRIVSVDFRQDGIRPTTTLLNYLRSLPTHKAVKEGCAEGDCGTCTVVLAELQNSRLRYYAVDSCLVFLPMLHSKQVITVENLRSGNGSLHPVQSAMVEFNGSQCGYCTPGIIMSLFSLYKNQDHPSRPAIDDALTGNLCRCTGYKPIVEAAAHACVHQGIDQFTNDEAHNVKLLNTIPREALTIQSGTQTYFRPNSLREALAYKLDHTDALVISGATDIALRVTKKRELLEKVLDLGGIAELQSVHEDGDSITIGAGVSLSLLMPVIVKDFPALHDMLTVFGSQQIRNLATLGGNLGTGSPIGDTIPVLMAYNAEITLQSIGGERKVHIDDFIKGYRQTDRRPDEVITSVTLPKLWPHTTVKAYKVSKRKDLDISTVSGGFRLQVSPRTGIVESIRLAYGGMADRVKRARSAEQFLIGKKWDRKVVDQALPLIEQEFTPISDARGSAEFRRVAARNLLVKFWTETQSIGNEQ